MGEDLKAVLDPITGGVKGTTVCAIYKQNLDKNYFPKQAVDYTYMLMEMIREDYEKENPATPFINQLKYLLEHGVTGNQVSKYLNDRVATMSPQRISFVANTLVRTKRFENYQELSNTKHNELVKQNNYN